MDANDASRVIAVVDNRIKRHTGSEAQTETTWAEVCGISADGKRASAYLYGDTANASENFRVPSDLALNVGDKVKVAWNGRGERWVYDVIVSSAYKKVAINPNTGEILTGDGTTLPTVPVSLSGHDHDADYEPLGHEHTAFTGDLSVPRIRVTATDDASPSSTLHPLQIGSTAGENVVVDGNEVMARNNGAVASLFLNTEGGEVNVNSGIANAVLQLGSDARLASGQGLDSGVGVTNRSGSTARPLYAKSILVSTDFGSQTPPSQGIAFGQTANLRAGVSGQLDLFGTDFNLTTDGYVSAPFRMYAASVSVTINSGSSTGSTALAFPEGRFTVAPLVFVTQASIPGGSAAWVVKITSSATTGCTVWAATGSGSNMGATVTATVHVMAVQLSRNAAGI